ncbi:MAG: hypothetical protein II306_11675 [Clostridia bacterium]|nr:hypothetical protein [Clostridia bacterium]MEE1023892.1 hypothetical protein [Acutalibacteraceae bacterium]
MSSDGYYVFSTEYSAENITNDIIVQFMIETADNSERSIYQMSFDMK